MCWLLPGSFDCFCCPHTSVHRPSVACLAVFLCGPGALFLHALSQPFTICPFPSHGWSAPDGLPLLLRKQPIWAAGDTPHLMPVEQGLPWHPVATPPPPGGHNQNTFGSTKGQNEQWREANRRRQRHTIRYRGLVPTPPPPPGGP